MSHPAQAQAIAYLQRDAMLHAAHLKMLSAHPEAAQGEPIHDAQGILRGASVSLPVAASAFDRESYPQCGLISMPVCDDPQLLLQAIGGQPQARTVWKMFPELAAVLSSPLRLRRVTAYVSLTGAVTAPEDPQVRSSTQPPLAWQQLMPFVSAQTLTTGVHFAGGDDVGHAAACVVRAWPIHGDIWEVGGLFTAPQSRGRGWATRVVRTAVSYLGERGLRARYVAREDHAESLAVARRVGLHEISRLEAWVPVDLTSPAGHSASAAARRP
jgi:ribosomal protein S18 acetylase RimI-like enzyme